MIKRLKEENFCIIELFHKLSKGQEKRGWNICTLCLALSKTLVIIVGTGSVGSDHIVEAWMQLTYEWLAGEEM